MTASESRSRPWVVIASLLLGLVSYLVFHFMSGYLGSVSFPEVIRKAMFYYRPITVPLFDLLLLAMPLAAAYATLSSVWFFYRPARGSGSVAGFCVGWCIPALVVVAVGENLEPGCFFDGWRKWPHTALVHFSPLVGILFAAWLFHRHGRCHSRNAA